MRCQGDGYKDRSDPGYWLCTDDTGRPHHPGMRHATEDDLGEIVRIVSEGGEILDSDGDRLLWIRLDGNYGENLFSAGYTHDVSGPGSEVGTYFENPDYLLVPEDFGVDPVTDEEMQATLASIRESIQTHVETTTVRGGHQ